MKSARQKVLFLMPTLGGGGAERVTVTLLRHLDRSRFEPHLGLIQAVGPYLEGVPSDVIVHDLKAHRVRYALASIIRLVRRLRPRVVHSAMVELNIATVLCRPFFPPQTKVLIREETSTTAHNVQRARNTALWSFLYGLYGKADKVICVADYVLEELACNYGVARGKLVRIYNPVDVAEVRSLAEAGGSPYSGEGPHLVAAGRLSPEKGFDILLDAMTLLRIALPHSQLTILGEGECRAELLAQRDRLGLAEAVHLPGFQPNPFPYFKHAALFVLPSRFEGFGLVVIEALAAGTAVVASDCPGPLREILGSCTQARLVPPGDPQELAGAIVSALDRGRRDGQANESLDAFLSRFDVKTVMPDYEELL